VSDVLVLAYHAVSPGWPAPLAATPEDLEAHLDVLERRGYRGVTFRDAVHGRHRGNVVAITFDDGCRSVLELALPRLEARGFPATVFVPTAFVGSGRPMRWPGVSQWADGPHARELVCLDWPDLRLLAERGWEVGSHTHRHPALTRLDDRRLEEELRISRDRCAAEMGAECDSIAYPYGAHDPRVVDAARRAGYRSACTLTGVLHAAAPLRWPRIGIYRDEGARRFTVKIARVTRTARRSPLVYRVLGKDEEGLPAGA
jgi:peptidoglycan/xylan/chitin deacetylase (PgdA/CDA1 family)